jgi:hypothetical protein
MSKATFPVLMRWDSSDDLRIPTIAGRQSFDL